MTQSKTTMRVIFGLAFLAGPALLAGCSDEPAKVTKTTTTETTSSSTAPALVRPTTSSTTTTTTQVQPN